MIKKTISLIIVFIFCSCKKQTNEYVNNYRLVDTVQNNSEKQNDVNVEFKEVYSYKKNFKEVEKMRYFGKTLKKFDNKRSFDTSFRKYSFPFVKRIEQPKTNLVFYLFKNEYADAIYGNSSYPFFIDDTKSRLIYYCEGDSLVVNKTNFVQYRNVRENITKSTFYYNRDQKLFELRAFKKNDKEWTPLLARASRS